MNWVQQHRHKTGSIAQLFHLLTEALRAKSREQTKSPTMNLLTDALRAKFREQTKPGTDFAHRIPCEQSPASKQSPHSYLCSHTLLITASKQSQAGTLLDCSLCSMADSSLGSRFAATLMQFTACCRDSPTKSPFPKIFSSCEFRLRGRFLQAEPYTRFQRSIGGGPRHSVSPWSDYRPRPRQRGPPRLISQPTVDLIPQSLARRIPSSL